MVSSTDVIKRGPLCWEVGTEANKCNTGPGMLTWAQVLRNHGDPKIGPFPVPGGYKKPHTGEETLTLMG